ncbi:hypothetical protein Tco_0892586 [Tanacetum coccineum]|uniref:Xylulose kinase-1 n=1 Tax=Tanacetum coccineum TaxID=301880 RepID=A0ABQ5CBP5_9ASTR
MTTLKFADTHNMFSFLSKSIEIDGFEQIVDFLNAHSIRHALTINPTIYISCIEQFWSTVKEKTINKEVHLHALVDGKKIIISEASVRRDLQLEDAEGVDCLPNSTIFEQLTLIGDHYENVVDEAVHKELGDSLVRAATTASNLEAEQDSGNIIKTRSKATPNESSSLGIRKTEPIQELGESTTTISSKLSSQQSQDKGKRILIEPVKPMNKKDQIRLDEEIALYLQAEFDEEERLAREKAEKEEEANIALIETWDDIQAKIDADHQLAERIRKHFEAKRAEEKRNKPPTKAQQRKIMCTYLKNMEGYELKDLKSKDFDSIQEMFDRAFKRVNTFEDFRTELVKGKEKRAGIEMIQEIIKKQKVEDDKETAELKQLMKIIPDKEKVAIDAIPLAVKSPSIVGWKIYKEGRKSYYQIMRADGKS